MTCPLCDASVEHFACPRVESGVARQTEVVCDASGIPQFCKYRECATGCRLGAEEGFDLWGPSDITYHFNPDEPHGPDCSQESGCVCWV